MNNYSGTKELSCIDMYENLRLALSKCTEMCSLMSYIRKSQFFKIVNFIILLCFENKTAVILILVPLNQIFCIK